MYKTFHRNFKTPSKHYDYVISSTALNTISRKIGASTGAAMKTLRALTEILQGRRAKGFIVTADEYED